MALRKAGIELTLAGGAEYVAGLKSANSELKLFQQQAKTAVAELGNQAKASDVYKAKMDGLGKSYDTAQKQTKIYADRLKELPMVQKQLNTELESSKKALTDSAKNTELLKKNYDSLKASGKASTEEIKAAKDAYQSSKAETQALETEVKQLSAAYQENQRELDSLPMKLSKAEEATANFRNAQQKLHEEYRNNGGRLKEVADGWVSAGDRMTKVGDGFKAVADFTRPISIAAAGGLAYIVKTAATFEQSMSQVKAVTKASDEEFNRLRNTAIQLGGDTKYSAKEVSEAMTEMAKGGMEVNTIIDAMPGVLAAAAASGETLGFAAQSITDTLTGFGLSGKDAARVADVMTEAANAGTIGFGDLNETFKYFAPVASSMGFTLEDVAQATLAMSKAGVKGLICGPVAKKLAA